MRKPAMEEETEASVSLRPCFCLQELFIAQCQEPHGAGLSPQLKVPDLWAPQLLLLPLLESRLP